MDSPENKRPDTPPPAGNDTPPGPSDRLTVALGNAALPGLGYAFARRRRTAAAALAGAVLLFWLLLNTGHGAYEVLLGLWWAFGIVHGALLRDTPARRPAETARQVAVGALVLALLATAGSLRYQAASVAKDVESARSSGDCVAVRSAQSGLSFLVRAANAPLAADSERTVAACDELDDAGRLLERGLNDGMTSAKAGFAMLEAARPGDGALARSVLDRFLRKMESQEPCVIAAAHGWLRDHDTRSPLLDRASEAAERRAPTALSECGDTLMRSGEWSKARTNFRKLVADHPGDPLADHARKETTRATQEIELDAVQRKLSKDSYCDAPTRYGAAEAYGKGTNRALFATGRNEKLAAVRNERHIRKLPDKWRTDTARGATMIVCTGDPSDGEVVATCSYITDRSPRVTYTARWAKVKIPVKVYELRTGKLVADRSVQIGGTSCPYRYARSLTPIAGSTVTESVTPSASDVRKAFAPLLKR
ncbi:tetratricopeptide repeat protein [Streptomyces rhizosphaericola]|uniref:tetratricopeptide repeat protein n=1 Tax=Streptomyces rhizosphaericola TaxID=2564098 RepID=UPI0039F09ABB